MLQSFGFVMVMQLNHWNPESQQAWQHVLFLSSAQRAVTETLWWCMSFFRVTCNPYSTGTTWEVLSFLFNLTWHLPPWRMTWEKKGFVKPCTSSFQHPSGSVCVCVWLRGQVQTVLMAVFQRGGSWMQTHWGGGFQWLRSLLVVGDTYVWQPQLCTTGCKLMNIVLALAVWILSTVKFLLPALRCSALLLIWGTCSAISCCC